MWIWSCSPTILFTIPSKALIGGPAELAFWKGSRKRQSWRLTSEVEMCVWIECGSGKGWWKWQVNSAFTRQYPDETSLVLLAQENTLLYHYTVCIHIDFLPHHHPLWGNVNNAWRSPIAKSSFTHLLLSGTHSYLTCNFLGCSVVFQSTIIHFHLWAVLPWDAEINSRSTLDTVNRVYSAWILTWKQSEYWHYSLGCTKKKCHCVENSATLLLSNCTILQKVFPNKTYIYIFYPGEFCKLYFPW